MDWPNSGLRICHLNIEGINRSKSEFLQEFSSERRWRSQYPRTINENQPIFGVTVTEYDLIDQLSPHLWSSNLYTKLDTKRLPIKTFTNNKIHVDVIEISETSIVNIYKPPGCPLPQKCYINIPISSIYSLRRQNTQQRMTMTDSWCSNFGS